MVYSFSQYLVEEDKTVYFTFGRMNPPTIGHGKLLDKLSTTSGKNPYFVYVSQSQDAKKNPLSYSEKVKHVRKMFPKHARSVLINRKVKTPFDALVDLYDKGYNKVVMVVGSDRVREFEILLNKYNNEKGRHGFYNFENIKVVSAGERDPDAEGVEGMSASKQRENAKNNDFVSFSQGLPKQMSNRDSRKLFNDVRKGMGLKEQNTFKNHVALDPVSEEREEYVQGKLFDLGDTVVIKESDEIGVVTWLGSNYLVVSLNEDKSVRKWLTDVEKLDEDKDPCWKGYKQVGTKMKGGKRVPDCVPEDKTEVAQDPDIKDREGSQPKKYHKGLSKSTKAKRDAHFQKGAKMDDDNPAAYKPAPGDKSAKTKPSKYTKRYKQMYGEQQDPVDRAKAKIDREKELDKKKHDRIMDRARMAAAKKKNRETTVESFYIGESAKTALKKKAKKTGYSYGTLKKVYDRGVAAWRTGHRPGTTPQQWGMARVNSFVTGGKTAKTADKDLAKKGKK